MQIQNALITGSFSYNGADLSNITSSNAYSASLSIRTTSLESTSSVLVGASSSFSSILTSVSSSQQQISSSLLNVIAIGATTGSNSFRATQSITGSLTVTGQIIAQTLNVQQVTSSIIYSSGSNDFGCDLNSRQTFTGSLNVTGSNHTIFGNVGIGTSSPNSYSGYTTLTINNTTTGAVLDLNRSGTRTGTFYADTSGVGIGSLIATNLDIFTGNSYIAFQTCGLERMRITSAGCVGIGNTSPTYQLDMCSGTTVNQRIRLQRGSDDTNQNMLLGWNNIVLTRSNLSIASNQTDFSIIQCGCDGIRTPFYIDVLGRTCFACTAMVGNTGCYFELGNDASGGFIENHGSTVAKSAFRIQTSKCNDTTNYAQFTIDAYCGFAFRGLNGGNGNVGIGTLSPCSTFDVVVGASGARRLLINYDDSVITIKGASNTTAPEALRLIGDNIRFNVGTTGSGSEAMRIISSGYVGIGTCSPSSKLTIIRDSPFNTGDQALRIRACNSDGYNLWMGASTSGYATIQSYQDNVGGAPLSLNPLNGGNVGIGTISPNSRLEVQKTGAQAAAIFINQCSSDEATIRFKSTHSAMSDFRIGVSILVGNAFEIYNVQCNRTNYMVNCSGYSKMSSLGEFVNGSNSLYHSMDTSGDLVLYAYQRSATGNGILSNVQACNTSYYSYRGFSDPYGDMAFIYSNGTFGSRTNVYSTIVSDVRCKTEIVDASSQWSDIKNLRVRNFKLIEDVEKDPTNALRQIGFIAQEVEAISPGLVFESGDGCVGTQPWKNVKSSIIHIKAVKALQEAMCRIEVLESCLGIS
jgi:hypothetical protein